MEEIKENVTPESEAIPEKGQKISEKELKQSEQLQDLFASHLATNQGIDKDKGEELLIPTGIDLLDTILGGGVCTGLSQFVGPPGCGKSALVAKVIGNAQNVWPGEFLTVYADSEHATTEQRLADSGVKNPRIKPYSDLTVEKVFKIIEGMCTYKEKNSKLLKIPSAIVWDSIANTPTDVSASLDNLNSALGLKARILSHLLPNFVSKLKNYNISLLAVNQLRDKIEIGTFRSPASLKFLTNKELPGGNSVKFNSKQLILLQHGKIIEGEYGFMGVRVALKAVKNKFFTPNIPITLVFSFERGFSNFWTNFELLKEYKRMNVGAWCSLIDYPEKKFRQLQAVELYKTDPKFKDIFDSEIKSILQNEFIKKYTSTDEDAVHI